MGKAAGDYTRAALNPAGDHIYILFEEAEKQYFEEVINSFIKHVVDLYVQS